MANYHCNVSTVSRAKGSSGTGSAAYRSAEKIKDQRTGIEHDYSRKKNVDYCEMIGYDGSRSELWNQAELAERRKDATIAREYEVSLPVELNRKEKIVLATEFGEWIHQRHGVAVDLCIHKIDSDNPHAHLMTTTRSVINGDQLGDKVAREWSDSRRKQHGLDGRKHDLIEVRKEWATQTNHALARCGVNQTVDHRSLAEQGIERTPQIHVGVAANAMEEKGIVSERGERNREIITENQQAQALNLEVSQGMANFRRDYEEHKKQESIKQAQRDLLREQIRERQKIEFEKQQQIKQQEKVQSRDRGMGYSR